VKRLPRTPDAVGIYRVFTLSSSTEVQELRVLWHVPQQQANALGARALFAVGTSRRDGDLARSPGEAFHGRGDNE
jgi:hypothetical protein